MKKDERTGEALFQVPTSKEEKTNQAKVRRIQENQSISLVNLRRSIEKSKTDRIQ